LWPDEQMMCEEALTHIGMADMVKVSEEEVCGATADKIEAILTDEALLRSMFSFANKVGTMTTTRLVPAMPTLTAKKIKSALTIQVNALFLHKIFSA
jgi:hypothetical protein